MFPMQGRSHLCGMPHAGAIIEDFLFGARRPSQQGKKRSQRGGKAGAELAVSMSSRFG